MLDFQRIAQENSQLFGSIVTNTDATNTAALKLITEKLGSNIHQNLKNEFIMAVFLGAIRAKNLTTVKNILSMKGVGQFLDRNFPGVVYAFALEHAGRPMVRLLSTYNFNPQSIARCTPAVQARIAEIIKNYVYKMRDVEISKEQTQEVLGLIYKGAEALLGAQNIKSIPLMAEGKARLKKAADIIDDLLDDPCLQAKSRATFVGEILAAAINTQQNDLVAFLCSKVNLSEYRLDVQKILKKPLVTFARESNNPGMAELLIKHGAPDPLKVQAQAQAKAQAEVQAKAQPQAQQNRGFLPQSTAARSNAMQTTERGPYPPKPTAPKQVGSLVARMKAVLQSKMS